MKKLVIVGLGHLGTLLAKELFQEFHLSGSTSTPAKLNTLKEFHPFLFKYDEDCEALAKNLAGASVVFFNVPPQRHLRGDEFFLSLCRYFLSVIDRSTLSQLVMVSSTSVYSLEGKNLLGAEELFKFAFGERLLILRPGGLISFDRHPGRFFPAHLPPAKFASEERVNLIRIEDVADISAQLIQNGLIQEEIDLVAPQHPLKAEYYQEMKKEFLGEDLHWELDESRECKLIEAKRLKKVLPGFSFRSIYLKGAP